MSSKVEGRLQNPYKPFAMFAAISKVSLRQGEGILLYKYF